MPGLTLIYNKGWFLFVAVVFCILFNFTPVKMSRTLVGPGQSSIIRVLLIQLSKAAIPLEKTGASVKRGTFVPRGESNTKPIPPLVTISVKDCSLQSSCLAVQTQIAPSFVCTILVRFLPQKCGQELELVHFCYKCWLFKNQATLEQRRRRRGWWRGRVWTDAEVQLGAGMGCCSGVSNYEISASVRYKKQMESTITIHQLDIITKPRKYPSKGECF